MDPPPGPPPGPCPPPPPRPLAAELANAHPPHARAATGRSRSPRPCVLRGPQTLWPPTWHLWPPGGARAAGGGLSDGDPWSGRVSGRCRPPLPAPVPPGSRRRHPAAAAALSAFLASGGALWLPGAPAPGQVFAEPPAPHRCPPARRLRPPAGLGDRFGPPGSLRRWPGPGTPGSARRPGTGCTPVPPSGSLLFWACCCRDILGEFQFIFTGSASPSPPGGSLASRGHRPPRGEGLGVPTDAPLPLRAAQGGGLDMGVRVPPTLLHQGGGGREQAGAGGPGVCHLPRPLPCPHVLRAAAEAWERRRRGCSCSAGRAGTALDGHRAGAAPARNRLLVGAPQAPALPSQGANRTGGLFACPLTPELSDCWRVPIDEGADLQRESKENQWLGVSVKSQGAGGKIVTCAHLYEARHRVRQPLETRDVIGRCFVLSQDLRVRDELDGGEWKFCEGRPQGHDRFGSCQQGLAAAFSPDHHYILFGAPGTYNWKGLLFVTNIDSSDPDQLVYKTPEPSEKVPGAAGDVAQNSYLGFSVDSGAGLTRRRELSFVTGAPRANHTGAVVILRRDSANRLVPEAVLPGQQLTSAFGYAVAVLDLNSDGWMDLVVGAPHFFERKEEIGGAAYVYINPAGRWDSATPLRLNGTRGSMFGIALSTAGDLNQDGFEDLAVGAPFDGAGKVYIYHGSNLGIVAKPAQVLDGEGVGVTAFGYSLSGGLDVDGNLYPDLLVGSLSDSVVLYRARPVVHVSRNVSLLPPNIDLEQSNCQHQEGVCVDVRACFSYTASPASYSPRLVLEYVFDADTDRRRLGQAPRVTFLGRRPSDPEHQFSNTVELPRQHARACVKATFQLQDSIRDKLRPIAVTLAYGIQGAGAPRHSRGAARHSRGAALPPLSPVLSPQQPSSHRTEVHFLKQGCGDDKICQSNLQLRFQFCARLGDADFLPLPRGADGTAIFAMSDQKDVALEIHVTNLPSDPAEPQRDGDDAHEAMLTATFPPELPYAALRPYDGRVPSDKPVVCLANQNGSQVECELGNPMKRGAQVRFFLILSTLGITIQTTDLAVELALSTISEQPGLEPVVARARVVIELPLSVTGVAVPPRLFFGGVVRGESAMRRESQVGSAVRFEVTVSNRGQSLKTLGSAFLTLLWPHEISNGKWLLYPLHLELAAAPGQRAACSPSANPLRLALEPPGEADPTEPPTSGSWWVPAPAERRRNVTLDCAQGTARCLAFHCPLHSFERAAVLTARGRLWNSTFLEEYLAVTSVELIVRASVSVTSSIKNLVLKDASTQIPISIYLDPGAAVAGGVPWWVILLAVLAGILVLALLVFILWKLGFFRRARYAPPAVPQYHAVKIPREERQQFREEKTGTIQRKEWAANLSEASNSHVAPSSA
ncbi:integrin alpha-7 isoform X6 [Phalacrocorax carbo]|uniref:integrin alpha-7 isoform X6 n=1 Tax=Phalacrocorax carbo TaxID=9209 RepID=UPI00311A4648